METLYTFGGAINLFLMEFWSFNSNITLFGEGK